MFLWRDICGWVSIQLSVWTLSESYDSHYEYWVLWFTLQVRLQSQACWICWYPCRSFWTVCSDLSRSSKNWQNTSKIGPEVPMTERTGKTGISICLLSSVLQLCQVMICFHLGSDHTIMYEYSLDDNMTQRQSTRLHTYCLVWIGKNYEYVSIESILHSLCSIH